jgi:hypothetical protein
MMRDVTGIDQVSIMANAAQALTDAYRSANDGKSTPALAPMGGETVDAAWVVATLAWQTLNAQWMFEATEREVAHLDKIDSKGLGDLLMQTDGTRWKTVQATCDQIAAKYALTVCTTRSTHGKTATW